MSAGTQEPESGGKPTEQFYGNEDGTYWVIVEQAGEALQIVWDIERIDLFGTTYTVERMAVRLAVPGDDAYTSEGEFVIECLTDHPDHVECWKVTVDE